MAARLKTRLSAGAALVTGIGMMGVATALPAQAATTVTYTCTVSLNGDPLAQGPVTVTMDTNAPETVAPGETLTVDSVTADITIPVEGINPAEVDGSDVYMTVPVNAPVRTSTGTPGTVSATLTSGDVQVDDGQVQTSLSSTDAQSIVVPVEAAGMSLEVLVPPTLDGTLSLPIDGAIMDTALTCETTETDNVIDTVVVTSPEMDEEPDDAEDTTEGHDPANGEQPPAGDAPAEEPAVPQVVQTDGLTPQMLPQEDPTAQYALGGLLLAGAGAGTVLVARRRATQH